MTETESVDPEIREIPEAVIRREKRRISIVWLIPLVALIIGGWLVYTTVTGKGPTITISFKSAAGLETGKTKIKYKDVDLGLVKDIRLSDDLTYVIVTAELVKQAEEFLSENTRFWVVRARVAPGGVSGLGTIFSGAYISMDPGKPGPAAYEFKGLEDPPAVTADQTGRFFMLTADKRGSLEIGSPVYYRQVRAGQVVAYHLSENGKQVLIRVFINAPCHQFVYTNSRFWDAGGVDLRLDAKGVRLDTASVSSLVMGGLAFGIPHGADPGPPAEEGAVFDLYGNFEAAIQQVYKLKTKWIMHFQESVRGLSPGDPVELHGIQIGRVLDLRLDYLPEQKIFRIPVLIEIEPERIAQFDIFGLDQEKRLLVDHLVKNGFRAQVQPGNILTGQQVIVLDLFPDAPPAKINWDGPHPEIPTVPTTMEQVGTKLIKIINKIDNLPLEDVAADLQGAVQSARVLLESGEIKQSLQNLSLSLKEIRLLTSDLRRKVAPQISSTLKQAQSSLANAEEALGADSNLQVHMKTALEEISKAARTLRHLSDYLERHPEALIRGKGK